MGHKHPPSGTSLPIDNKCAHGILTSSMRQKLSKAFDMRYWWMKYRIGKKQFDLTWAPGKLNFTDYFTKHHPPCENAPQIHPTHSSRTLIFPVKTFFHSFFREIVVGCFSFPASVTTMIPCWYHDPTGVTPTSHVTYPLITSYFKSNINKPHKTNYKLIIILVSSS